MTAPQDLQQAKDSGNFDTRSSTGQRFYADLKSMNKSGATATDYANLKGFEAKRAFRQKWAAAKCDEVRRYR
eukprot:3374733-Alexandrium_andersonii.AAC.1